MKLAHIPAARKSTRSLVGSLTDKEGTCPLLRCESSSSSLNWPPQTRFRLDFGLEASPSTVSLLRLDRNSLFFCRFHDGNIDLSFGAVVRRSARTTTVGHSALPSPRAND